MILIENTLTGKKEPLPDPEKLRLFVCGPTVYNEPHIGNARVFVFFDLFVKYLRSKGRNVSYLQNITDIDDKIIARAEEEGISPKAVSKKYAKLFKKYMKDLKVDAVNIYAPATDFIPEIIDQVKRLIEEGHAYEIRGDGYYFDLSTFPDYGKLSGRTTEQADDGVSRIDENPNKKNRGDFCLWKFSKPGEPFWKADIGNGRPGWHIEDTAISEHFFGPQYDIHGGGSDLVFPHHEAEIAQQESASHKKPFVKLWMHLAMLTVNGKKMSKSLGNVITIPIFLKSYPSKLFRYIVFSHHYRTPFDYTPLAIEDASKSLVNIQTFVAKLDLAKKSRGKNRFIIEKYATEFDSALEDDFNTPKALGVIFEMINEVSSKMWNLEPHSIKEVQVFIKSTFKTLDIDIVKPKIPMKISLLVRKREKLRTNRQFMQADVLRNMVDGLGFIIEDTPQGSFVWPKRIY